MKKITCLVLVACFCLALAACGGASSAPAASAAPAAEAPAAPAAPAAEAPAAPAAEAPAAPAAEAPAAPAAEAPAAPAAEAPAAEAPAAPAAEAPAANNTAASANNADLAALVAELNAEQDATQKPDDPILIHYDIGGDNTILYKVTFDVFEMFVLMAEAGEQGALDAYNDVLSSLPDMQKEMQEKLEQRMPGVNVVLRITTNANFNHTIAAVENGVIVYDRVNGIGTLPADDAPVLTMEDLPPELQEALSSAD